MNENFQKKIRKLFETNSNLKNELFQCHSITFEYIKNNIRIAKIGNAVYHCKIALEKAVDINEQFDKLAGKTENSDKIFA